MSSSSWHIHLSKSLFFFQVQKNVGLSCILFLGWNQFYLKATSKCTMLAKSLIRHTPARPQLYNNWLPNITIFSSNAKKQVPSLCGIDQQTFQFDGHIIHSTQFWGLKKSVLEMNEWNWNDSIHFTWIFFMICMIQCRTKEKFDIDKEATSCLNWEMIYE